LHPNLAGEAERLYVDATYTSKGHFIEANRWARRALIVGLPWAMLSGLSAGAAAITAIFTDARWLTAVLALIAAVVTSVREYMRSDEKAEAHGMKAARYLSIAKETRFFLLVELETELPESELVRRLRGLRQMYDDLTLAPPHVVSPAAYAEAKAALERGEAEYDKDPVLQDLRKAMRS
jgi:hypothetical protein